MGVLSRMRDVAFRLGFSSSEPQRPSTIVMSPFIAPTPRLTTCPPAINGFSTQKTLSYMVFSLMFNWRTPISRFCSAVTRMGHTGLVLARFSEARLEGRQSVSQPASAVDPSGPSVLWEMSREMRLYVKMLARFIAWNRWVTTF